MYETIRQYVKACENCQKRGKLNRNEQLIPLIVEYPFHRVGIDIKGPLPITSRENRYIIIAMDYLTKWPEVKVELRIFDPRFGYLTRPDLKFLKNCYLDKYRSNLNYFTIIGFVSTRRIQ